MTRSRTLAALVLAAGAAAAEPSWQFRQGDILEYEAATVVEWTVNAPATAGRTAPLARQRQEEQVALRLEIKSVDDAGNAHLEGTFPAVRVENTSSAGHVTWDSSKEKTTGFLGFKRYEALLSVRFTAVVSPDGIVLSADKAGTPDRAPTPNTAKEHIEAAALDMHHPTTPRAWLEIVFGAVPPERNAPRRAIRFIEEESVEFRFARSEQKDGRACAKITFDTPDRDSSIRQEDLQGFSGADPNAMAWGALRIGRKKGEAWFDRRAGVLWRLEASSDVTVGWGPGSSSARMTWNVALKPPDARRR
ncbi:MAG: hypothetical protein IT452_21700 [Planctomycetia bacterium]|nr:hypothetical protein [Planctomycetia bacterium]